MVIPLFVGRGKSIKALDQAMEGNKQILLIAQKSAGEDDPKIDEIYKIGTLSNILQMLKLPDGTIKVLVEGVRRAKINDFTQIDDMFSASVEMVEEPEADEKELDVLSRSTMHQFEQYIKLNKKVPPEILSSVAGIDEPSRLADTIAAHMAIRLEEKQGILELFDISERLEHIIQLMEAEIDLLQVEKRIRGRVK
jgi:ATP-dependent Lon protease